MRFFWKAVAANLLAIVLTLTVLGMAGVVGVMLLTVALKGQGKEILVRPGTILVFDLDVNISDSPEHGYPNQLLSGAQTSRLSLFEVTKSIEAAAKDKNITALFLHGSLESENYGSSYSALREVRDAIGVFRQQGKPVIAYLENPTVKDYYLASAASKVELYPFGVLSLNGMASESMFLGDALKKYGVGVQVTRVGKYKSATEMFTNDQMSDADREQLTALLTTRWGQVLADLADRRGIDIPTISLLANQPGLFLATDAVKNKLVDKVSYYDEVLKELKDLAVAEPETHSFRQVELADYAGKLDSEREDAAKAWSAPKERIAVVYVEGEIVDGESSANTVGGDTLARHLRELREDKDVKAVVMRVNSPGGSANASEVIQREVRLLKDAKPLIASFGAVAASGGYWISAPVDYIYAEPTTITGSIGVFGLKFNFKDLANEHGLTFDGTKTATYADMDSIAKPWSPGELALAQTFVDFIYDQFIEKVAKGRKLDVDRVREIAQGRVWSGMDALKLGLVDGYGGLADAVNRAAEKAGIAKDKIILREIPDKRTPAEALLNELFSDEKEAPLAKAGLAGIALPGRDPVSVALRQWQAQWRQLQSLNDPHGVYALLPFQISF